MTKNEKIALELTKALIISQKDILDGNDNLFNHYSERSVNLFTWVSDYVERSLKDKQKN